MGGKGGPDLPALILGIWRLGAVYVPLFTAFAASTVADRVSAADVRVIVTDPSQAPPKVADLDCTIMMANLTDENQTDAPTSGFIPFVNGDLSFSGPHPPVETPRQRWSTCSPPVPPANRKQWSTRWPTLQGGSLIWNSVLPRQTLSGAEQTPGGPTGSTPRSSPPP